MLPALITGPLLFNWEALLERAGLMVYYIAKVPVRKVLYISDSCKRFHGCSAADIYRDALAPVSAIHPDDREVLDRMVEDWAVDVRTVMLRWIQPDGRIIWSEHHRTPVRDDAGDVIGMWGFGIDVTDRMGVSEEQLLDEPSLNSNELRALSLRLQQLREQERSSLARELHDELGQLLTTLKLDFTGIIRAIRELRPDTKVVDRLQSAAGHLDLGIATLQRIATELRPAVLDHCGLETAIRQEAHRVAHRASLRIRVNARVREDIDLEHTTVAFRVCQEALTNVVRHAGASAVTITVRNDDEFLMLRVKDNGRGFDPALAQSRRSLGLLGMRERARALGGDVSVATKPGRGATLLLTLPMRQLRRPA